MRTFPILAVLVTAALGIGVPRTPVEARETMRPLLSAAQRGIASDMVPMRGDVRDLGRLGANEPVRIGLMFEPRHKADLDRLTLLQSAHGSRYYHRFVTNAEWNAYFAPTEQTYSHALLALERAGFRIQQTFSNRGMIRAVAPAATAERYFNTVLHRVSQVGRGFRYVNVTPGTIPLELRPGVSSVVGLHSTVGMHFPIHFALREFSSASRVAERAPRLSDQVTLLSDASSRVAGSATPRPITTSTPAANPNPDPTLSPDLPIGDYALDRELGYGPPIFADAYDYPVQHGYGGSGRAAGSVIDSDFSDHDAYDEFMAFGIPRMVGIPLTTRVCTDPNDACTLCQATISNATYAGCDPLGESTLDAQTIMSLAPAVHFIEYLVNSTFSLDDVDIDGAYETVDADNEVDALNSSFGECETDDPSSLYSSNIEAEEGAAKGIMFSASAGDTGAESCGTYVMNGAPQTITGVSQPASAPYFVAVGGTAFQMLANCSGPTGPLTSGVPGSCYNAEVGWSLGGGGVSILEPQPSWQTALVAAGTDTSATGRNVPDIAFEADIGENAGVPESITMQGSTRGVGGTSLASPMWVAMQTEIDQVLGSRSGLVTPRLYAIAGAGSSEYAYAFRDILIGNNFGFTAGPGYDEVTGIGSVIGWDLAGTE